MDANFLLQVVCAYIIWCLDDALFDIQNDTGDDEIWKGFAVFRVFWVLYNEKLGFNGFYGYYLSINVGSNFSCMHYMSYISKHMFFCYLYLLWLMVFPPRSYNYLHFTPTHFKFSCENQPFFSKNP